MGLTVTQLSFDFGGSNPSPPTPICGSSSVDRASAFQAEGREFEPRLPLYQVSTPQLKPFLFPKFDDLSPPISIKSVEHIVVLLWIYLGRICGDEADMIIFKTPLGMAMFQGAFCVTK